MTATQQLPALSTELHKELVTTSNVSAISPSNINLPITTTTTTTCDTVRKPQKNVVVTSSSSLLSQTSALAKFNRIIDNTVPATNYYSRNKQQLTSDLPRASSSSYQNYQFQQQEANVLNNTSKEINSKTTTTNADNNYYTSTNNKLYSNCYSKTNDNQTKRNDVHYLLKQLNSFSDIEEIEIVDLHHIQLQQQQQYLEHQKKKTINKSSMATASSVATPTSSSMTMSNKSSPTSVSHKIRHSDWGEGVDLSVSEMDGDGYGETSGYDNNMLPQQYDDYIFQSCHYLETSCFATTITTAIAGSSSHEFRPSTPTTSAASTSSNNKRRSPVASAGVVTKPPSSSTSIQKSNINNTITSALPSLKATATTYRTTNCLTGNEAIKTQLSNSSHSSSSSSSLADRNGGGGECSVNSSNGSDERRAPFFKCCYTPIDRWREKRHVAATAAISNNKAATSGVGGISKRSTHHNGNGKTPSNQQQPKTGLGDSV